MRMLDNGTNAPLDNISIYLTTAEAKIMIGYLEQLLADPKQHHSHVSDDDFQHEINLTVYREDNLHEYDERSQRLIVEGE